MHQPLDAVADAFNPLLALVALVVIVVEWRQSWKVAFVHFAAAALGLAGVYCIQAVDAAVNVWPRFHGDYSLHTAFAVSVGMSLVIWRRQWFRRTVTIIGAYLTLIVALRYHSIADVLSAAVVAFTLTALAHFIVGRTAKLAGGRNAARPA